jgi:hypothetical protein
MQKQRVSARCAEIPGGCVTHAIWKVDDPSRSHVLFVNGRPLAVEETQVDLDVFMEDYNKERTNQGRYCQGRTPLETFNDGLQLYNQYVFDNEVEEMAAT